MSIGEERNIKPNIKCDTFFQTKTQGEGTLNIL